MKILENYLFNRNQTILYNNRSSDTKLIPSGLPQGGVGSPELFNITFRDFPNVIKFCKLFQYAEDSTLVKPIYNSQNIKDFQNDLNEIQKYCEAESLTINSNKSVHLRISFKNVDNLDKYSINNTEIPLQVSHKHLGYIINNKLTNNEYVGI